MRWLALAACAYLTTTGVSMAGDTIQARPLVSGEKIPVGTAKGIGPLSAGLRNSPVGAAYVYGSERPDLFLTTGRYGREPGLYLYRCVSIGEGGVSIFGDRVEVSEPFDGAPPTTVYQAADGRIFGVWIIDEEVAIAEFDPKQMAFVEKTFEAALEAPIPSLPGVVQNPDGSIELVGSISHVTRADRTTHGWRDEEFRPWDGAGIAMTGMSHSGLAAVSLPGGSASKRVSQSDNDFLYGTTGVTQINLGPGRGRDIIVGTPMGNLVYYHNTAKSGLQLEERRLAATPDGIAVRHPTIYPAPVAYPDATTGLSGIIAGGEGLIYYYAYTGEFTDAGAPIFDYPREVLQTNAHLCPSTLAVTTVIDWNGNGVKDIVAGNSDGRILFFENKGTNDAPAFMPGIPLKAGGREISIQADYRGSIQGPGEARWGYICPTAVDWDGDGLPDIVMSDITSQHTVYLNRGTPTQPKLEPAHPIYCDGMPIHGTWRVQPAVANLDGRTAYACLDDDDEFHLYWQIDIYNVEDGGKIRLDDGSPIRANFLHAGGTGRLKLILADWDRDGLIDMIVGTPRHGSVPNPETGLPQSLGLPGAGVLFMKNVGTNAQPMLQFPRVLKFRGEPIFFGHHACGPAVADFGNPDGPDLIVAQESGAFFFFRREDVSF